MVVVAQLVRALDCGSRGRRFETGLPPLRGVFKRTPFLNLLFKKMKNFLKTIGIIMIILGTYIFIIQTVNLLKLVKEKTGKKIVLQKPISPLGVKLLKYL